MASRWWKRVTCTVLAGSLAVVTAGMTGCGPTTDTVSPDEVPTDDSYEAELEKSGGMPAEQPPVPKTDESKADESQEAEKKEGEEGA